MLRNKYVVLKHVVFLIAIFLYSSCNVKIEEADLDVENIKSLVGVSELDFHKTVYILDEFEYPKVIYFSAKIDSSIYKRLNKEEHLYVDIQTNNLPKSCLSKLKLLLGSRMNKFSSMYSDEIDVKRMEELIFPKDLSRDFSYLGSINRNMKITSCKSDWNGILRLNFSVNNKIYGIVDIVEP